MSTETKCNGNEKKKIFFLVRKTKTLYPVKNNIKTYKELLYFVKKKRKRYNASSTQFLESCAP